jgi:hypothetical protein
MLIMLWTSGLSTTTYIMVQIWPLLLVCILCSSSVWCDYPRDDSSDPSSVIVLSEEARTAENARERPAIDHTTLHSADLPAILASVDESRCNETVIYVYLFNIPEQYLVENRVEVTVWTYSAPNESIVLPKFFTVPSSSYIQSQNTYQHVVSVYTSVNTAASLEDHKTRLVLRFTKHPMGSTEKSRPLPHCNIASFCYDLFIPARKVAGFSHISVSTDDEVVSL